MKREQFRRLIDKAPVLFAGVDSAGAPADACPEMWLLQNGDGIAAQLSARREAGCAVICCPTFGANRRRLAAF
ncbi:MAG: hypothetical protein JXA18_02005, partial [Chitinispirillaceae bacterium]|nr:hypothetical protein [Chitinispirillaceae bacterium]